jgi:mono/diheme cytochrome c family protein
MKAALKATLTVATITGLVCAGIAMADNTVTIQLPPDARQFAPGPGQALAQANCTVCHAADYVYMQPPLTKTQWTAEVSKMKTAYGAPIPDDAVDALVTYLVSQNGKP